MPDGQFFLDTFYFLGRRYGQKLTSQGVCSKASYASFWTREICSCAYTAAKENLTSVCYPGFISMKIHDSIYDFIQTKHFYSSNMKEPCSLNSFLSYGLMGHIWHRCPNYYPGYTLPYFKSSSHMMLNYN